MILFARQPTLGGNAQRFETEAAEFTIGRGADCDWTLPDPGRLLSKRHCRVTRDGNDWRVIDLSSNGVTVNGGALAQGTPHPIRHGDRLGLGAYEIDVALPPADADPTLSGMLPLGDAAPFGAGAEGGRLIGDPFVAPGEAAITEPFDVALPSSFGLPERAAPERDVGRQLRGFDDDAVVGDDVSDLHAPFQPPRPAHALLPEDWHAPDRSAPDAEPDRSARPDAAAPLPSIDEPPRPPEPFAPSPPGPEAFPIEPEPVAAPHPSSENGISPSANPSPTPSPTPPPAPPPFAHPAAPAFPSAAAESAAAVSDPAALAAFAAFARGAGLAGTPHEPPAVALEQLGRAFRAFVVGLRRVMIARAVVKGEFRIDRTVIRPFGNNPLKFATDDDDALAALLGIGRQAGMSPEQAVADSLRDILRHELALTKAVGAGIAQLMDELSPAQIEGDTAGNALDGIAAVRRSRAWNAFVARHARLQAGLGDTLDGSFGQAFARAYEAALAAIGDDPLDDTGPTAPS